ncbi:hypothetical protein ORI20_12345 [Mycobacterium sp. CVI_P3]|uniref:PE-PGRS family protein n=1 Tax=Mycobacterium pinniadriaticum TaxID=2994102 RepID=A0ABT3SF30_9MYCO|nr:hypothetical protein [Mycobacterium pinniadriaticum]MCX2931071.1 hypothetical protein [Mycobacterium pinniadriaticum]MCX2937495.1 hypothetical protein [Mycobacterium pinniadriaticum]
MTSGSVAPAAAAVVASSVPFGLPQVLAVMNALAAFNPDTAATMQFVTTSLIDELNNGTPLGEAMVNVSLQLSPSVGGDIGSPLGTALTQIGPMLALAPAVISGAMTVLAAIPEAVIPVVGAVVVAVINTASAVGTDGLSAAVQAGLYDVVAAVGKGIATMVNVVKAVLQDIAGTLTSVSAARTAAPAAAGGLSALPAVQVSGNTAKTDTRTKRATAAATPARGTAGPRPRHSASASATASSSRSTGSARAVGKRHARPAATNGTAKSAR